MAYRVTFPFHVDAESEELLYVDRLADEITPREHVLLENPETLGVAVPVSGYRTISEADLPSGGR